MKPRSMTPQAVSTVLAHLAAGQSVPAAAARAGLHAQTIQNWIRDGKIERTRLLALGHDDVDSMGEDDSRISDSHRAVFAFARAARIAENTSLADVMATIVASATTGLEESTTVIHTALDPDTHEHVEISRRTTIKRTVDTRDARWLAERMDPERLHLATNVQVTGADGGPIEIAGMTGNQAEAFATFTRVLLDDLLGRLTPRQRERLEPHVPDALQAGLDAITTKEITPP